MAKNCWPTTGPPLQFMWENNGRVYVGGGYSKAFVQDILTTLRSDTQTKEASAPTLRLPASDSASARDDSSAAKTTGQLTKAEKNSPKAGGDASPSKSGSKSGSGGSGPDVIGLRIGMTPDEARAIFKSRGFGPPMKSPNVYDEKSATLAFNVPAQGVSGPVPNGTFLDQIYLIRYSDGNATTFWVTFAPVPRHEGIVSVYRNVVLSPGGVDPTADHAPTFDIFEKTLVEKYGTPTYIPNPQHPHIFYWIYDSNGTLRKPGSLGTDPRVANTYMDYCHAANNEAAGSGQGTWVLALFPRRVYNENELLAQCGATFLSVEIKFEGTTYSGRGTLVRSHDSVMTGFDASVRALKEAIAISNRVAAAAKEEAIKQGQKRKPEF